MKLVSDKMNVAKICMIGDGHLYEKQIKYTLFPCISLEHSIKQSDYLQFKKALLEKEFGSNVSVNFRKTRPMVSTRIGSVKLLKGFRSKYYPGGKKSIISLLSDIDSSYYSLLLAIWFGDDGCIYADTKRKNRNARLSLASCDTPEETQAIVECFNLHFGIKAKIVKQKSGFNKENVHTLISFSAKDSRTLYSMFWNHLKDIPSMQYKFRYFTEDNIEYNSSTSVEHPTGMKIYAELTGDSKK